MPNEDKTQAAAALNRGGVDHTAGPVPGSGQASGACADRHPLRQDECALAARGSEYLGINREAIIKDAAYAAGLVQQILDSGLQADVHLVYTRDLEEKPRGAC